MKTAIVTIGDEILIGQIVDTNSSWIANQLTLAGFEVEEMASIGDDATQIKDTITNLFQRVDAIVMTGGLGPTKDDITKKTLCEYFGTELIFDDLVLENIQNVISSSFSLNELTRNQAYVPKDCTVIQNTVGTAPITWFERENDKVLVSMPGVPYEMRYGMINEIIPRLQKKYNLNSYLKEIFIIGGYTESGLAIHLTEFEDNLPEDFGLAYLPSLGIMKLRLFVKGDHRKDELDRHAKKIEELLGDAILAREDIPIEKIIGQKLLERGLSVGLAESCTGGNIAHLITLVAGCSQYFKGSIVSYSNEAKSNVLNVSASNINKDGVSESVVLEMAKNVQKILNVDCSIAVSGIAGPDGGTENKPVGTLWVATTFKDIIVAQKYQMGKNREANITRASNIAMLQLLNMLK